MNKLRSLWESVVYVGMKPGSAPVATRLARWFGPFRSPVERFLTGGLAANDPLYLTNRTFGQRLRVAIVVMVPCLLLAGVVTLGIGVYIRAHQKPPERLTNAEVAARMLPKIDPQEMHLDTNHDLEVVNAAVESGHIVAGTVRNNTDRPINNAAVIFELTNSSGARLGAIAAEIPHVDPRGTSEFRVTVEQEDAVMALVREVRLR